MLEKSLLFKTTLLAMLKEKAKEKRTQLAFWRLKNNCALLGILIFFALFILFWSFVIAPTFTVLKRGWLTIDTKHRKYVRMCSYAQKDGKFLVEVDTQLLWNKGILEIHCPNGKKIIIRNARGKFEAADETLIFFGGE